MKFSFSIQNKNNIFWTPVSQSQVEKKAFNGEGMRAERQLYNNEKNNIVPIFWVMLQSRLHKGENVPP